MISLLDAVVWRWACQLILFGILFSNAVPSQRVMSVTGARSASVSNGTDGTFISYSDTESWSIKLDYIKDRGLGGAMTWELSSDDASHTMIKLMDSGL